MMAVAFSSAFLSINPVRTLRRSHCLISHASDSCN